MRDTQLDTYRSLCMMYIVCIIHSVYWLGFGKEPFKSLILIEMPVIFFISGASLSQGKSNKGYLSTLKNRIKRVMLPYYIYAAATVAFIALMTLCGKVPSMDITAYNYKDIIKILLSIDIPQSPFCWHLWFIIPYMILSCIFVFHQSMLHKVKPIFYLAINILIFILIQTITGNYLIRHIFCYNIFMLAGYCFYKQLNKKQIICILLSVLAYIITAHYVTGSRLTPMQSHKFPADTIFLCYTTFALCALSLLFSCIRLPYKGILTIWNKRGYTIYLYQNIVIFAISLVIPHLYEYTKYSIITGGLAVALIFTVSTLLSCITYPIEQRIISKIKLFN